MKLNDYLNTKQPTDFQGGSGLPVGKTIINLNEAIIEEMTGIDNKPRWKIKQDDLIAIVPKKVMDRLKAVSLEGKTKAEIVRQGTGLKDTTYTVLGI